MDAGAVATALEEARFDARQASRYEDLADDLRGPAELAEWERIAQLLDAAGPGAVYDPNADDVVQAELAADAAAAAAREAELREAVRIAARANHLQVLRDLGTLDQAEPAEGDELTRRADGYVQADVDAWLAHALAPHRGHYRDPAARKAAAGLLTPPVLAHAALLGELLRLVPGPDYGPSEPLPSCLQTFECSPSTPWIKWSPTGLNSPSCGPKPRTGRSDAPRHHPPPRRPRACLMARPGDLP